MEEATQNATGKNVVTFDLPNGTWNGEGQSLDSG
jgi:hypothetical protein